MQAGKGGQGNIGAQFLSRRGTAFVDPRTNILFVTDIPSKLEEVRRIIRQIDTTVRQVLIEARIVIADDKFSRELGIRFGNQTGATLGNHRYALGLGGSLNTTPVVSLPCTTTGCTRTTATQTPFELASGIASAGYSTANQLNVNLPVVNPAGQLARLGGITSLAKDKRDVGLATRPADHPVPLRWQWVQPGRDRRHPVGRPLVHTLPR